MKLGLEKFYNLVEALEEMPGIGKKSALRIAYDMVFGKKFAALKLSHAIEDAIEHIKKCDRCGALSEHEICDICLDEGREVELLCIVESAKDIFIIEETSRYKGRYFVLESIEYFDDAKIREVVKSSGVKEILFALTPSIGSDSLMLFVEDKLEGLDLTFTKIAQGVPTGVSLENIDLNSISKAIDHRSRI